MVKNPTQVPIVPTLEELSEEIRKTENKLSQLRDKYLSRSGVLPPRTFRDSGWRWTIFMTLGIAYITFVVYYLGIKEAGRGEGFGIPDFLYNVEVQYYGILTFYMIFGMINIQNHHLHGYQILLLFIGFWCTHWLIYDWSWWAMEIGFGHVDPAIFWTSKFYSPLLIEKPPMWLFLTLAILGSVMSLYTFSVPKNYTKLVPSIIWLYTVYMNGLVCSMVGLTPSIQLIIGLILITIAFGLAIFNTFQYWKEKKQEKGQKQISVSKGSFGPLRKPYGYILIFLAVFSFIFLATVPLVGFLMGMIVWYIVPLLFMILNAIRFRKLSRKKKIVISVSSVGFLALIMLFLTVAMPYLR
jgi:hypothetical protein